MLVVIFAICFLVKVIAAYSNGAEYCAGKLTDNDMCTNSEQGTNPLTLTLTNLNFTASSPVKVKVETGPTQFKGFLLYGHAVGASAVARGTKVAANGMVEVTGLPQQSVSCCGAAGGTCAKAGSTHTARALKSGPINALWTPEAPGSYEFTAIVLYSRAGASGCVYSTVSMPATVTAGMDPAAPTRAPVKPTLAPTNAPVRAALCSGTIVNAGFDLITKAGTNYHVNWTVNCATQTIDFTLANNAAGWMGIGFRLSADPNPTPMANSDIVQVQVSGTSASCIDSFGESTRRPRQDAVQSCTVLSFSRDGARSSVTFRRPLAGTGADDISLVPGVPIYVISSFQSTSTDFSVQHSNREFMIEAVDFFSLPTTNVTSLPTPNSTPPTPTPITLPTTSNAVLLLTAKLLSVTFVIIVINFGVRFCY